MEENDVDVPEQQVSEDKPQDVPADPEKEGDGVPAAEAPAPPNPKDVIGQLFAEEKGEEGEPWIFLVSFELDDSSSVGRYGYKPVICENHNRCLDDLRQLVTEDLILVATRTFHGYVHNNYVSPRDARDLTILDYPTMYGTPMNLRLAGAVRESEARAQEFRDQGRRCKRIVFFLSDGLDTPRDVEHVFPAADTCRIVTESIEKGDLIVLALGIKNGAVDFRRVFRGLGVPDKWIAVCEGNPVSVDRSLDGITRIISNASSSVESFQETRLGSVFQDDPNG